MDDRWDPPDPRHRMTSDTHPDAVAKIRAAWARERTIARARTRGRHDTRLVVALVVVGTVATFAVSDSSQDVTLRDLGIHTEAESP